MTKKAKKLKRIRSQRPIHARIAQLRKHVGLTQRELASQCDVDETAVSHWENGFSAPNGNRLPLVARALGVAVPDLFVEAA